MRPATERGPDGELLCPRCGDPIHPAHADVGICAWCNYQMGQRREIPRPGYFRKREAVNG